MAGLISERPGPTGGAGFVSEGIALPPVPGGTADGLLARAAADFPDRAAVIVPGGPTVTFAEVDRQASAVAQGLRELIGGDGARVLLSAVPVPEFPALYHGIIRSGNVVVPANQMYGAALLEHALTVSGARVAVVTPAVYETLRTFQDRLPALERVLVIDPDQDGEDSVTRLLAGPADLATDAGGSGSADSAPVDPERTACVLFTSGSTRLPKPVQLSHRNLLTGAVQLSTAHGQNGDSVVLNGLPIYHPMHMNASLHVGATHVLSGGDVDVSVEDANTFRATHFYTLPFRLVQLATHPRLGELRFDTVRLMATGGLALRPAVLRALDSALGVPVLQGYGMCEASSLATSDLLDAPRAGSVGRPLPGSRIRIADLDSRAVLPVGAVGEIQIQGPNVMKGYLTPQPTEAVDAEGWLSTGDAGYLDAGGDLFYLDRLRDVFHSGGVLVAPGVIEAALAESAEVGECAVVGTALTGPDGEATVPVGYVVLRVPGADLEDLRHRTNAGLPPEQRLRRLHALDALPRLPNAKVDRAALAPALTHV
jgi:long-chain acyl-CoA synthetase